MGKVVKPQWPAKANLRKPRGIAAKEVRKLSRPFLALIALLLVVSVSVTVYAISSVLPDPSVQGNNTLLAIGRISKGSTLPSQSTSVKLAYQNKPVNVNVFDGAWCGTSDYDRGTGSHINSCGTADQRADVEFKFQTIDNDTGAPFGPAITVRGSTMAAAVGPNKNYTVNLSALANLQSTDSRHFVLATVSWVFPNDNSCTDQILPDETCPGGTNFFKFSIPDAGTNYVTYAVTNDDSFPLSVESLGPTAPKYSDMSFEFAAPCGATDADRLKPLKWQDADYGETNQIGGISWVLIDESAQGGPKPVLSQSDGQLGSQGELKTYPAGGFQFINDHKYRWTWQHVDTNNGVQLFLPFDSYNYVRKCATVDIDKSATTHPGGVSAGEQFAYNLTVKHTGPNIKTLNISDPLPTEVTYVPDPAFNQPPPTSVAGQTLTWNFAQGSPQINTLNTTGVLQISFKVKINDNVPAGTIVNKAYGDSVDVNGSNVPITPPTTDVPVITVNLTNKPFFSVPRGDVTAGAGMSINGKECGAAGGYPTDTNAGVVSWNQGAAKNYTGAGAGHAGFALGHMQGFVTGQGSSFAPGGLSFANDGGSGDQYDPNRALLGGLYGGEFGSLDCVPDYSKNATAVLNGDRRLSTLFSVPVGGTYTVPNGTSKTVYINNGNLIADANIRFSGAYANAANVPGFTIVVRGNILIDPAVSRLDGFYIAQPTTATATNGVVYTCAPGASVAGILTRTLSAKCGGKQLTVNGAVIARQVWLLRTFGSLSANTPAESFDYAPEFWLNTPFGGSFGQASSAGKGYDAITSLPPVL